MPERLEVWLLRDGYRQRRGRTSEPIFTDDGFELGVTKPDASNTGPRVSETQMKNYAGTLTNTTAGTAIDRLIISGRVDIKAPNVTVRDCRVIMPASTATNTIGVRVTTAGATGVRIEHVRVEVPLANRSYFNAYGIQGSGFTAHRCDLSGTTDGIMFAGINQRAAAVATGCYIHDLPWDPNEPRADGSGSHPDGIQSQGNLTAARVEGSYLRAGRTSAMLVTQDHGTYDDAPKILRNWFDVEDVNAGSMLNIKYDTRKADPRIFGATLGPGLNDGSLLIQDNRFTPLYPSKARLVLRDEQVTITRISSHGAGRNTYEDGTFPVPYYEPALQVTRTTYGSN